MKQLILSIITAAVLLLPAAAEDAADGPLSLTVERAVKMGLENNYNLKIQENSLSGKLRNRNDAWNVLLPDVSASVTLNRSNTTSTAAGTAYAGTNNPMDPSSFSTEDGMYDYIAFRSFERELSPWTAVGSLSAQLALNPAMINGAKALDLDYRSSALELESAEQSVEINIKNKFYNLLLLQEQIDVLKKNIETTGARLESMEEMYRHGYVTELDVLNTKAGLSSLNPALLKMENAYEQLKMAFLMDLGLDLDRNVVLDGTVEVSPEAMDADYLVGTFLADRIDIQQLTVTGEILENAESAAANRRLPSLVLGWSYSPYQADPFEPETWGDDGLFGDNGSFSVTMSLPVEDWLPHSGTWNDIQDARNNSENMEHQKKIAMLGAEMEIRSLAMALNTSIESMKVLNETVEINLKSYHMSLESYNSGQLSLLDLETAENDLLQAELELVSEKFNYISSLLNLEAAVNRNLTTEE